MGCAMRRGKNYSLTVTLKLAVWLVDPEVAVTVIGKVPVPTVLVVLELEDLLLPPQPDRVVIEQSPRPITASMVSAFQRLPLWRGSSIRNKLATLRPPRDRTIKEEWFSWMALALAAVVANTIETVAVCGAASFPAIGVKVTVVGLMEQDAPVGAPEQAKVTVPPNVELAVIGREKIAVLPCTTVAVVGDAAPRANAAVSPEIVIVALLVEFSAAKFASPM